MSILFKKDRSIFVDLFLFSEWLVIVSLEKTVYVLMDGGFFP